MSIASSTAGAELAVIPAVTPHYCVREPAISPLPLFNIFEPLVKELSARSVRRVGVFGTRFVIDSALFGMADVVEVVQPRPDEVEYIHRTYVELAQRGKGSEAQYRGLTNFALTFCKRDGVDAIILAGTDLALLFDDPERCVPLYRLRGVASPGDHAGDARLNASESGMGRPAFARRFPGSRKLTSETPRPR